MENKNYVIVRGDHSGVFFGELKERSGQEVELRNARKLWFWDGAAAVEQIAKDGVKNPGACKFTGGTTIIFVEGLTSFIELIRLCSPSRTVFSSRS